MQSLISKAIFGAHYMEYFQSGLGFSNDYIIIFGLGKKRDINYYKSAEKISKWWIKIIETIYYYYS